MRRAPIALFVYNRPEHTSRTVESLRENGLAKDSDLFVFADGAREEAAVALVKQVGRFVRGIKGFQSVTIIERERNFGLSGSIVSGVTQLCDQYGRAIVVEDDVVTAPDFLPFMNRALDRYADEPGIFSVSSFNYPMTAPESYPYDVFFSYRFPCWGWGTWKDRWEKADWSVGDYPEFMADPERQKRFDRGGEDLTWMLTLKMEGRIDGCWDVVWGYTHSKHDAVAMLPVSSKAYNIGLDGSGAHCARAPFRQTALNLGNSSDYRFPDLVALDPYFVAMIQRLHRPSIARKFVRFLRRCAPRMKWHDSRRVPQAKT
jgi:hypothetical protein